MMFSEGAPTPESEELSEDLGLPPIDWQVATRGARSGDYEPAYWVKEFNELPELATIPEPEKPKDVMLVHYMDRRKFYKDIDKLMELPREGEISTCLLTRRNARGGPIGIVLNPGEGAIREMHVIDVNSTPGWQEMEKNNQRHAANPIDRKILRQLTRLGRLTPEQLATIRFDQDPINEIFVESSKVKGILGIIWNQEAMMPAQEIINQAEYRAIPLFIYGKDRVVRRYKSGP